MLPFGLGVSNPFSNQTFRGVVLLIGIRFGLRGWLSQLSFPAHHQNKLVVESRLVFREGRFQAYPKVSLPALNRPPLHLVWRTSQHKNPAGSVFRTSLVKPGARFCETI